MTEDLQSFLLKAEDGPNRWMAGIAVYKSGLLYAIYQMQCSLFLADSAHLSVDASTLGRWIGMTIHQNSITALNTLNPYHPTTTVL